jgi:hypothetical protein
VQLIGEMREKGFVADAKPQLVRKPFIRVLKRFNFFFTKI